jgi:hypothetical protein
MEDFYTLMERYAALNFTEIQGIAPQTESTAAPKCKESLITTDGFISNFTVPALPPNASEIIENGVSPAPVGKIVTIDDYTVTSTVKDTSGNVIKNLAVVPLDENEINQPGLNTGAATGTGSSSTSSASGTSSVSGKGSSSSTSTSMGVRTAQGDSMPWMMVSAVAASFLFGFMA